MTKSNNIYGREEISRCVNAVSRNNQFYFTYRNLYYEMVRNNMAKLPNESPHEIFNNFKERIHNYEKEFGVLNKLIKPEQIKTDKDYGLFGPDMQDYSVRRVIVFDSIPLFLLFTLNRFYQKIEIGFLTIDNYPQHIWKTLYKRMDSDFDTVFYLLADSNKPGFLLKEKLESKLSGYSSSQIRTIGLTFEQAFRNNIPVMSLRKHRRLESNSFSAEANALLKKGLFSHIEYLPPIKLMQWVYASISKGYEEIGFG